MTPKKIRLAYEACKVENDPFWGVDEEVLDLIYCMAEYLIKDDKSPIDDMPIVPLDGRFISLKDCEQRLKFIAANTMSNYCHSNMEFRKMCAVKQNRKWYVDPEKVLEYFHNNPIFKKRLERLARNC
jgi:hypothetical protein